MPETNVIFETDAIRVKSFHLYGFSAVIENKTGELVAFMPDGSVVVGNREATEANLDNAGAVLIGPEEWMGIDEDELELVKLVNLVGNAGESR